MKFYLSLAWRNLWRNKRRTLLATTSVFFAVLLAIIFRSTAAGQHDYMIQMSVSMYTGYLQIQKKGYWDERSFDYSFEQSDSLSAFLMHHANITTVNPRIESVALISRNLETRISPVIGIDPVSENLMSGLRKKIVKGKYLTSSSQGILIAEGLAKLLRVSVGDSVIIFGQGYKGVTAAGQLPIEGIVKFPIPKMNDAMIFLSLKKAQALFNAFKRVTGIALMIKEPGKINSIQKDLSKNIDKDLVVMNWKEMSPEIVQAIEADVAGEVIIMFVLYIVIGFGVFGTVMMMTIERTREFGLLISLGMKRGKVLFVTTIESLLVSLLGAIIGTIAAFPLLYYFYIHPIRVSGELAKVYEAYGFEPIIPISVEPIVFSSQMIVVFIIALIASFYPLFSIRKIQPVSALQGRGGKK